ncbi:hypothetical protein FG386_003665 [Cryptosporidium ryanae]|uniref:uncharacterized protein n=1 Tax=Cryptosporidium ryanae TaxID=515981 RepID=UPI00351A9627|nr:hypothetical protein FG386_003665 [Cryptosporidium ryanae]
MKREIAKEERYISFLEKKLRIGNDSKIKCEKLRRKKVKLYEKIEKDEGMGDNFMGLLDNIISGVSEKSNLNKKRMKVKDERFGEKTCSFEELELLLSWRRDFNQKVQGLFNRLSEGNMNIIAKDISEMLKKTVHKRFHSKQFMNNSIFKFRKDKFNITNSSGNICIDRLLLIVNTIEDDVRELFIKNCIIQPQTTVSLVTVHSAVVCSIGILSSTDNFFSELLFSLNRIYNEKLYCLLKMDINRESQVGVYNNKLILRHIIISIVSIYRCGFISGKVLESFISAGIDGYSSFKSYPFFWECFLDNVLTILRCSGFFIKSESNLSYKNIIAKLKSIIPNKENLGKSAFWNIIFDNSDCYNTHRLKFIVEELGDWMDCSQDQLLLQKLKRRCGLIERQLFTIHNWSMNFSLIKHLQVTRKSKLKNINSDSFELLSYSNTLIDYPWRTDDFSIKHANYFSPSDLKIRIRKLSSYYNINNSNDTFNINLSDQISESDHIDSINEKLMDLASKIRLTSDIQKSIFLALMGAEDVYDAIQRITSLNIVHSNIYIESIVNVILLSALSESTYNNFYFNVLKGLTELPLKVSKKFNREIIRCFSQQLGLLNRFSARKTIIFSKLIKECIFGDIFDLKILKYILICDLHSLSDSVGLFFVELILSMINEQKNIGDICIFKEKFSVLSEMPYLKEVLLFVLHRLLIPAFDSNIKSNIDFSGISKIEILRFNMNLRSLYPSSFYIYTKDGERLSCRSFGVISSKNESINLSKENVMFVLVHPYGIMGGSSSNMLGMALSLADRGYGSIIFDHRGVKDSTGRKSFFGNSEVIDVVSICNDVKKKNDQLKIVLVGSSAGATIAGSAVDECENIIGYVGIGYVFGFWPSLLFRQHFNKILFSSKHKLFILGSKDGFTSVECLNTVMKSCKDPKSIDIIPDVGHFELESPYYDDLIGQKIDNFVKSSILGKEYN